MEIISRGQALQAAVIRNAGQQEVEIMRSDLLSVAETYADHMIEAATQVRQIIEP